MEPALKEIAQKLSIEREIVYLHLARLRKILGASNSINILGLLNNGWEEVADTLKLTPRGKHVFSLILEGFTDKEIAELLDMSFSGVRKHREKMLLENECGTMVELIAKHHTDGVKKALRQHLLKLLTTLERYKKLAISLVTQGAIEGIMVTADHAIIIATPQELRHLLRDVVRTELAAITPKKEVRDVMNEKQAAEYLGQKPGTLRQWRTNAKGPMFHKKGRRIFYLKSELDTWMAEE